MTFPVPSDFTSPSPADAWWVVQDRLYSTNGASLLATVRQQLGLPATPADLR